MLFTIKAIETDNGITFVSGTTSIGNIKGIWNEEIIPEIGMHYYIELDFGVIERKQVHIYQEPIQASLRMIHDKVVITGLCEDIDELYYLRLSVDGLVMLEMKNDDMTIQKGDRISFSRQSNEINIYPIPSY